MNVGLLKNNLSRIDVNSGILRGMVDRENKNKCEFCGHTLFLGHLGEGSLIEIKCPECKGCTPFGVQKTNAVRNECGSQETDTNTNGKQ